MISSLLSLLIIILFFDFLTQDCKKDEHAHIERNCTPNKKTVCSHVLDRWDMFLGHVSSFPDTSDDTDDTTVPFEIFKSVMVQTKEGEKKRLKLVQENANMAFIIDFINTILPNIIHHRNELKHFRSVVKEFTLLYSSINIDMDFSENHTVPMKSQPQSMYWTLQTVTVHSGITKSKDGKSYHPYISDSNKHNQVFVNIVMNEMLAEADVTNCDMIVVDSDNCSSQYKSVLHFYHLQELTNNYNIPVVRMYGIPGHGKGEVDHVGGTAKVTIRKMAARGHSFYNASNIVEALVDWYAGSSSVKYYIKEISPEQLETKK